MRTSNYKAHDPTPEERAFIYQQIQEINEFAPGLEGMVVMLEEKEKKKTHAKRYAVTLVLGPKELGLQLRVEADDIYTALSVVKYEAKESLSNLIAAGGGGSQNPKEKVLH